MDVKSVTKKSPTLAKQSTASAGSKSSKRRRSKRNAHKERLELKPPCSAGRGVIYIKNLPRGFFEQQLRDFFSQFGKITRLRLARSKKSGLSRGHGWIEFAYAQVAQIAAETMNNYLMYNNIVKCEYKGGDELHPRVFKGCFQHFNKNQLTTRAITLSRQNKKRSEDTHNVLMSKFKSRLEKKLQKLKDSGMDYTLPMQFPAEVVAGAVRRQPGRGRSGSADAKPSVSASAAVSSGQSADNLPASAYLILDSEDDEITFKTPPNTVKISRRDYQQKQQQNAANTSVQELHGKMATNEITQRKSKKAQLIKNTASDKRVISKSKTKLTKAGNVGKGRKGLKVNVGDPKKKKLVIKS